MNTERKEQMYKDWEENIANSYYEEIDDTCFSAFLDGVKWADEHPDTEDLEAVMAFTFRGLGWLAENIEADMGTTRERALGCIETLQFLCNDVIMELRNKKIHAEYLTLDEDLFPEVTFENSPQQVELKMIKED